MTMSEPPTAPFWGNILKSNSNGTYFGLSAEFVNRNEAGYVDFEKLIGLDGVALVNVVADPGLATVSGSKTLQSRITHNDGKFLFVVCVNWSDVLVVFVGATWKPLTPPAKDSLGKKYDCDSTVSQIH
jgi:hypothetical protein